MDPLVFLNQIVLCALLLDQKVNNLYGKTYLRQSRIDSFLDANLVFAREFQVYVLEINELNEYLYKRMNSAYLFYLDGIEKSLNTNEFIVGNELSIADVSFVCDLAQFLRERDNKELINKQGFEVISLNFETDFPKSNNHLKNLYARKEFKEIMGDYLKKAFF